MRMRHLMFRRRLFKPRTELPPIFDQPHASERGVIQEGGAVEGLIQEGGAVRGGIFQ